MILFNIFRIIHHIIKTNDDKNFNCFPILRIIIHICGFNPFGNLKENQVLNFINLMHLPIINV